MNVSHAILGLVRRTAKAAAPSPASTEATLRLPHGDWTLTWTAAGEAGLAKDGDRGLAFHGELYNAPDLRKALNASPEQSPAEVLLRAASHWGPGFIGRVDFSGVIALWEDGALSFFRDISAARNLYYAGLSDGGLAFSTHLDALFKLPDVERHLSRRSLHEYLRFLDISAPNTIYDGVFALTAGDALHWRGGDTRVEPLPPTPNTPPMPATFGEAVDNLEALLLGSIERRLAGMEHPAAFLSGGVDSSLLCALARRVSNDITAVTVGFDGEHYDESPVARAIAAHLGLRHEVLRFNRTQHLDALERFNHQAEQPFADPAIPPTLLAFEHCREHYDAVLDGSGADESVGVMPPRHVRVAVRYADRLPLPLRGALMAAMAPIPKVREYTPIFDFEHPAELMIRWKGFTRREIEALCGETVSFAHTRFFQLYGQFPRHAHFERFSALEDSMPNDRLHQSAAVTGLPAHYPYCEARTDAFIRALPQPYRYRPEAPKRILRKLLARHVPRHLWEAPKHGFDFPLREFLAEDNFALVRRYLDPDRWHRWDLLSPGQVAGYGRRYLAGEQGLMFRVWTLISLAAWLEGQPATSRA